MKISVRGTAGAALGAGNASLAWETRCGWLLEIEMSKSRGLGEASPLPGYSDDTLDEAAAALASVSEADLARALDGDDVEVALARASALVPAQVPSARMALETAVLDWWGRARALSVPALLGARANAIDLAWLAGPSSAAALEACRRAQIAGFATFKLKVGAPAALTSELEFVGAARHRLGSRAQLRLDANRGWSRSEAEAACQKFAAYDVEFIEEPCHSLVPPLPGSRSLALDESLRAVEPAQLADYCRARGATVIVLKPMVLGGILRCLRLGQAARVAGLEAVVSHSFDGPLALAAATALALALGGRRAHGLAPHAGLAAWPAAPLPLSAGQGRSWNEPGLGRTTEPFA